jgi:three-Cys-motif partner protein
MKIDEIGYWSEVKLDVVKDYAKAYSTILHAQTNPPLHHVYIDAFAGAGVHLSKTSGYLVPGSPLNALNIDPPFKEHHLIDLDRDKANNLRELCRGRTDVSVYDKDCNEVLLNEVFPKVKYQDYKRGLCLLDPYGLHLDWEVIYTAGQMKSIEIFLNFPVMDMNMNALWHNPEKADPQQVARMTAFWGDESWKNAVYEKGLFDFIFKADDSNAKVSRAFQHRLKKVAGFQYVPDPIPMRNSNKATLYYLFFASNKPTAKNIVEDIFQKYKNREAPNG